MSHPIKSGLNPIIKWSGGKKDELKEIRAHLPTNYNTYLEPFIGGGALFFHLKPTKAVIGDVHRELIDFYWAIQNGYSKDIYQYMMDHPNTEETYYKVRSDRPITSLIHSLCDKDLLIKKDKLASSFFLLLLELRI